MSSGQVVAVWIIALVVLWCMAVGRFTPRTWDDDNEEGEDE